DEELNEIEKESRELVKKIQRKAWLDYLAVFETEKNQAISHLKNLHNEAADLFAEELKVVYEPGLKEIYGIVRKALRAVRHEKSEAKDSLLKWYENSKDSNYDRFNSKLFTGSKESIEYITN